MRTLKYQYNMYFFRAFRHGIYDVIVKVSIYIFFVKKKTKK